MVFGGPGVGSSGTILLSSLNGVNGFKLDGEDSNDYSGSSVSAAGDINGDGHADLLIGALGYPGSIDRPQLCGVWRSGSGQQRGYLPYRVLMAPMVLNWMAKINRD